jgi:vacuolar-type H+-ATPase subunit I/STV1
MWICGLVCGFSAFIVGIISGDLYSTTGTTHTSIVAYAAMFAVAGFYAIAAVVIMILRKKME